MDESKHANDRIGAQKKTPPVTSRGLTDTLIEVGEPAVEKHTNPDERSGQEALALHLLELAREEFARAKRNRIYYASLGRKYGLTNQAIGDTLGVTEAGVRMLIKREPGAA